MFDRTIINRRGDQLVPYEKTINHNLAPTADHMRLLKEFAESAVAEKLLQVYLEGEVIAEFLRTHVDLLSNRYVVVTKINGVKLEVTVDEGEIFACESNADVVALVKNSLAEAIAQKLLIRNIDVLSGLMKK